MAVFDVLNPLAHVTPRFTEEQLADMVSWFDENSQPILVINNGEPINVVTIEQFMTFLELKKFHRRSFHYPSYLEIMQEVEKLKAGVLRVLTKDQFIYILNLWVLEPEIKHELLLAFKVFDTEKRDYLEIDQIDVIVTEYGDSDAFSEEEAREILRDANFRGHGIVSYEDFIESMFSNAPELYEIKTDYLYEDPDEDPSVPPEPVEEEPPPPVETPAPPPAKHKKAKGKHAKGKNAKGKDAKGKDAKGKDAKGKDAKGMDAKGKKK